MMTAALGGEPAGLAAHWVVVSVWVNVALLPLPPFGAQHQRPVARQGPATPGSRPRSSSPGSRRALAAAAAHARGIGPPRLARNCNGGWPITDCGRPVGIRMPDVAGTLLPVLCLRLHKAHPTVPARVQRRRRRSSDSH